MSKAIETYSTTDLTPIEVLLDVDKDGRTTAKKLYNFLQLDPSNYAKWARRNIPKNEFAEEGVDWTLLVLNDEYSGRGHLANDYKLTASFAKKLAMKSHSQRGEQAREYFIKVEEKLKQVAIHVHDDEYISREVSKIIRRTLTDAINEAGLNQKMHGFGYKTFTDLIYKTVLNMNAAQFRKTFGLPKDANIREHLNEYQLKCVAKVERLVQSLVENGMEYKSVKELVETMLIKRLPQN